jgi:hypothetical protein
VPRRWAALIAILPGATVAAPPGANECLGNPRRAANREYARVIEDNAACHCWS